MRMEGLSFHGPSGLQIAFSHGASGGPGHCAPMPPAVETTYPFEDQDFLRFLWQRFVPDVDAGCVMCSDTTEDCSHLFFECPMVQPEWIAASLGGIDVKAGDAFWHSICQGPFRREAEWQNILATLWAIWLHRNEIIFKGRLPSTDVVQHSARGMARSWHLGGMTHSGLAPLL